MSVSEPLGATVRTRYDATATAGPYLVTSAPSGEARRRRQHPARSTPKQIEATPILPSSAIHELRTPLTSIHGYAQVLQRGLADNPRAANGLAVIVRESGRLTQMLAELSDLAELSAPPNDVTPCQRADVDIREVAEAVAAAVASRDPNDHEITLVGEACLTCDARRFAQALTSVLTNAIRYSPAHSRVTVSLDDGIDRVRVYVSDEGIGIRDDDADRVFLPFERGANAREFGARGLGLGLFIARRALAVDGGTLTYAARPSVGTVFTIELPRD